MARAALLRTGHGHDAQAPGHDCQYGQKSSQFGLYSRNINIVAAASYPRSGLPFPYVSALRGVRRLLQLFSTDIPTRSLTVRLVDCHKEAARRRGRATPKVYCGLSIHYCVR